MTITETRLTNARHIAQSVGGQAQFARRLSASRQQASHIIGENPVKPIGNRLARRIESTFGYPVGWLDTPHEVEASTEGIAPHVDVPLMSVTEFTSVPQGDAPLEYIRITKQWLRKNIDPTAFEYLSLYMARGDSMAEAIRHGDTLLVDRGQSSIREDGVYVLAIDGEVLVKRAQIGVRGSVMLTCDNSLYQPIELTRDERERLTVLGRVAATIRMDRM